MSFPNIPDVNANITLTRDEVINLLYSSIAFEELGLAHIINVEAEKIQYVIGTWENQTSMPPTTTISDLIKINKAVDNTLKNVIKKEMLLQFKYVVANESNATLTDVTVTDSALGMISTGGILAPGQSFELIATCTAGLGLQANVGTVYGYLGSQLVSDSDLAYYFGDFPV